MTRLILREAGTQTPDKAPRLHSVVLYVGQGAGAEDSGRYEILGIDGEARLAWRYTPIRLWQMEAAELLALGSAAFLPLIGQTQIRHPEQVLPAVVESIRKVADELQRKRLMTALVNLMSDEEMIAMIEQMIDSADELLLELPYIRRAQRKAREEARAEALAEGLEKGRAKGLLEGLIEGQTRGLAEGLAEGRSKGRTEGLVEGLVEGRNKGRTEGLVEGLTEGRAEGARLGEQKGILDGLRQAVQDILILRFDPSAKMYFQCERQLQGYVKQEALQRLLAAAVQSEDMAAFILQLGAEPTNGHQ